MSTQDRGDIVYREDVVALIGRFVQTGLNPSFAAAINDAVDLLPAVETHEVVKMIEASASSAESDARWQLEREIAELKEQLATSRSAHERALKRHRPCLHTCKTETYAPQFCHRPTEHVIAENLYRGYLSDVRKAQEKGDLEVRERTIGQQLPEQDIDLDVVREHLRNLHVGFKDLRLIGEHRESGRGILLAVFHDWTVYPAKKEQREAE